MKTQLTIFLFCFHTFTLAQQIYWADKLGLLVMSDLPNSWGEPDAQAQAESDRTLREMIKRDYNHPAIFSWITFNETWGLRTTPSVFSIKSCLSYVKPNFL